MSALIVVAKFGRWETHDRNLCCVASPEEGERIFGLLRDLTGYYQTYMAVFDEWWERHRIEVAEKEESYHLTHFNPPAHTDSVRYLLPFIEYRYESDFEFRIEDVKRFGP